MNLVAAWLAIAAATAALSSRWRDKALRLCVVAIGSAVALAVTFLLTGPSVTAIFERAAKTFGGTVIVTILSVAVVVVVLPRLRSRADRWAAATLCAVLAAAFTAVAMMLWRIADDGLQFATLPEIRTGEGILDWRNSAPRHRIYGVLVEGRLGERTPGQRRDMSTLLASYQCENIGPPAPSRIQPWLPSSFTLHLADDSQAWAQGISSVRQAWGWPASGYRVEECGLRAGDPVVFWGQPGATHTTGSDKQAPAVNETAVLAYGDIAAFRASFGPGAERTGRATLALAVANGVLAAAIMVVGARHFIRLRRDGTGDPPRIT
ncbi:hypothetical protein CRM90_08470 [Mycobacterium sp. ENV421]|uniref:hypothetical protein n=1 Tax=Mycobacterium sp. ENV421 TaxID=1213407 RepID=UPI000C9B50A7|nr:hypothetical protein [Mycobacterium sp. ENV421]PND58031.1 hypothetical protein CRM90_08470 [Mycobacterium sp. ENV421]